MLCRKCGAELRTGARFCGKCGTPAPAGSTAGKAAGTGTGAVKKPEEETVHIFSSSASETRTDTAKTDTRKEPVREEKSPELIIHMPETRTSSSNGQFNEWFSEPGDL